MNDDRISELYKGEIWTDALQQRAQRRIHWLCSQAAGDAVLDIGCSQGIASILLGREGFTVTGIDIQPSRIEYARADLESEPDAIQERVRFDVADGSTLEFDDDSFDAVLLGEVIEHLAVPSRLLTEIRRVLRPGGIVAITTPFGLSPHHDHKQTFYPAQLWALISEILPIRSVAVEDNYFRVVAECPSGDTAAVGSIDASTIDMLDHVWLTLDSDLRANRHMVADLEKQIQSYGIQADRKADEIESLKVQIADRSKTIAGTKATMQSLRDRASERERHVASQATKIDGLVEKATRQSAVIERQSVESAEASRQAAVEIARVEDQLSQSTAKHARIEDQLSQSTAKHARVEDQLSQSTAKLSRVEGRLSRSTAKINALNKRVARLEGDRAKLRDRLAISRWKLASTTSRKWWRIGVAIGQVKSNVLRVFVLPFDIVSILFSKSSLPPRPQPTRVKSLKPTPSTSTQSKSVGAAPKPSAQGSDREGSPLVPMIVTAPASMSLAPPPITNLTDLRVAAILDEMSSQSFGPECSLVTFGPHNWLEVLERERPNLLLVESAWRGNGGSWEYRVGTYSYPESVGLPDLTALVDWCRAAGVPTVFWNKEDPVHFEKFKEAAALFDVVFTTDENMIGQYERLPGSVDRVVGVLPFAAQPAIHNPVGSLGDRDPRPVFAGAYYRNRHHSRRDQLDMLLDAALPFDLMIYDRMGGAVSDSFGFPERFQANIEGTLPYEEMVQVYRTHRVFLNVNSVSDSPTMFSRRVFELLASGTPVVSTSSVGVEQMFGGVVDIVETEREANDAIGRLVEDHDWWLDRSVRGIESVFASNTYADRLHTIAKTVGLSVGSAQPRVSIVVGPDFELAHMPRLDDANVVEILSIGDHLSEPDDRVRLPVRRIDVADRATSGDVGHAVATSASGDWLAFASAADDLRSLRSLTAATRITPAEIYLPSPTWALGHEYLDGIDEQGLVLASTDFVGRTSWSPWPAPGGSAVGGRIYSVPVVDD